MVKTLIAIMVVVSFASAALCDVRATLPLQGYHRPGMFMPVRVEGAAPGDSIEITGAGVVTTRVARNGVAAVLVTGAIDNLLVNGANVEGAFRAVPEGAQLMGQGIAKNPRAAEAPVITLALDPLDPVPGPAAAWEALDELIIDAIGAARIGDAKLVELLAAGVTIVVLDAARPPGALPWQREPEGWVLRQPILGPRGSVFAPAMVPVAGTRPGWPDAFRRQVLLGGVLFAILATGVAMSRAKLMIAAIGVLVVGAVAAAHAWKSRQPAVSTVGGSIIVESAPLTQVDAWSYHVASDDTTITLPAGARPMAQSTESLSRLQLRQIGPGVFECALPRGGRLASLSRTLTDRRAAQPIDRALTSPLSPLARSGYVRPGALIIGQIPADPWAAVVLRSARPAGP